jgi:hypothetical protein
VLPRRLASWLAAAALAFDSDQLEDVTPDLLLSRRRKESAFLGRAAAAVAGDVEPLPNRLGPLDLRLDLRELSPRR